MELKGEKLYTVQEIAEMFGYKDMTVYGWIWKGKLDAVKVGQWRVPESALQAFLEKGKRRQSPAKSEN